MRIRINVSTNASSIPWDEVQRPGRSLAYSLLAEHDPRLGEQLHDGGLGPYRMVPIGHSAPVFPQAPRRKGVYAVGGSGWLELGSPMPAVIEAFAKGLHSRALLDWGGVALHIHRVEAVEPPAFAAGHAIFRTIAPVVMKGSGRDDQGVRATRQAWLLPYDAEFPAYFTQNLRHKAATLGLGDEIALEAITFVGAKRSFVVKNGSKVGAPVEVRLVGEPAILRALWSWGLGQANPAGFGWIAA